MAGRNRLVLLAVLFALLAGALLLLGHREAGPGASAKLAGGSAQKPLLGLMTTLPLYWPEADGPGDLLRKAGEISRARNTLEQDYRLKPLDTLVPDAGLGSTRFLLLAQPRALSGEENVALDNWVRGGGRVLLLVDPMLTGHSIFAVGDRRRPQDVVLISPILARWGLELTFDENQPADLVVVWLEDVALPVRLAGRFRLRKPAGGAPSSCRLLADALAARCKIGKGSVLAIADAALVEDGGVENGNPGPLKRLAAKAFLDE